MPADVATTPAAKDTMGTKLLVLYGSQTHTCERIAKKAAEEWKGLVSKVTVLDGNNCAHELEDVAGLKDICDVLVVCTSSFGDGDPPDNYSKFLLALLVGGARRLGDEDCALGWLCFERLID